MENKRAQEEIVGFVLIVVIIIAALLIGLVFLLRSPQGTNEIESVEVVHFLESMNEFTTQCEKGYSGAYIDFGNLVKECYFNTLCFSGENACNVLNRTSKNIMDSSWIVGKERPYSGYELSVLKENNTESVFLLYSGSCPAEFKGGSYPIYAYDDTLEIYVKICLNPKS